MAYGVDDQARSGTVESMRTYRAGIRSHAGALTAILLAALALTSGCGLDRDDVLYDDDASAAEVIDVAEAPSDAAIAKDGSMLLLFTLADQEGGDAEKGAFRLLDPHGVEVISDTIGADSEVTAAGDGFVLASEDGDLDQFFIAGDGTRTPLKAQRVATVRSGDVIGSDLDMETFVRPGDVSRYRLPNVPGTDDGAELLALDPNGTLWAVPDWTGSTVDMRRSSDGGRSWDAYEIPVPESGKSAPYVLHADAGHVAMVFVDAFSHGGDDRTTGLWTAGPGAKPHPVEGLKMEAFTVPDVAFLPDGRLIVGESDVGWNVATDASNDRFERIQVPEGVHWVEVCHGQLLALGGELKAARSSDDGRTWERIDY